MNKFQVNKEVKDKNIHLSIKFKENNFLHGTISEDKVARIGVIFVEKKYRGSGLSQELLEKFIELAKSYDSKQIAGFSTSPAAIKFAAKLLGKENLNITTLEGKKVNYEKAVDRDQNFMVSISLA